MKDYFKKVFIESNTEITAFLIASMILVLPWTMALKLIFL